MHKPSLAVLVHKRLFPNPRPNDPTSFTAHITRNLVPEVRVETATFYGALDCIEAQYPGLDYSHPPHRMRLGRFQWHRRLFRVFDEMKLTEAEISSLCHWEGTKWARERYERDNAVKVHDTTGEDITVPSPPRPPRAVMHVRYMPSTSTSQEEPDQTRLRGGRGREGRGCIAVARKEMGGEEYDSEEEDESEGELDSIGLELNQRLLAATAARDPGQAVSMDPDFEQWLKEASERGSFEIAGQAYPMSSVASNAEPVPDPVGLVPVPVYRAGESSRSVARTERVSTSNPLPIVSEAIIGTATIHRTAGTAR